MARSFQDHAEDRLPAPPGTLMPQCRPAWPRPQTGNGLRQAMGIDSRLNGTESITSAFGRAGTTSGWMRWRAALGGPAVAVASLIAALIATRSAGLPLRDPDGVASGRLGIAALLVCGLVLIDILVRASRRSPGWRPTRDAFVAVRRERWTVARVLPVSIALLSFFASYFAYRNLKSVVPLL